jgi:hypothetical protein
MFQTNVSKMCPYQSFDCIYTIRFWWYCIHTMKRIVIYKKIHPPVDSYPLPHINQMRRREQPCPVPTLSQNTLHNGTCWSLSFSTRNMNSMQFRQCINEIKPLQKQSYRYISAIACKHMARTLVSDPALLEYVFEIKRAIYKNRHPDTNHTYQHTSR